MTGKINNKIFVKIIFGSIFFVGVISNSKTFQYRNSQAPVKKYTFKWSEKSVEVKKALNIIRGQKKVVIAVIDTGIDLKHPDLKQIVWKNHGEIGLDKNGKSKESNGIDDDANGFVDDVHGWNFSNNSNNISDQHGHGTHIAGIIKSNSFKAGRISRSVANSKETVNSLISIMALKYFDPKGSGQENLQATIKAIYYAIKMKVDIINYSGGGSLRSLAEKEAIKLAGKKGILFVAAAGNEKSNSDRKKYYPANYELENIISVTAIDQNKKILSSSNYGKKSVDIAAPGENIFSTLNDSSYGLMTGTSQATAFVSAIAGLIISENTYYQTPKKIIEQITLGGELTNHLVNKTKYRTRLNAYRSLVLKGRGVSASGAVTTNVKEDVIRQFVATEEE